MVSREQAKFLWTQTTNLIINLDHDEWILSDSSKTLVEIGARTSFLPHPSLLISHNKLIFIENETELSFFNREAYETFKTNPAVCLF